MTESHTKPPHHFQVQVHKRTDDALLVSIEGQEARVWLPKSKITILDRLLGGHLSIVVPDWLAREKGMFAGAGKAQMRLF